MPLSAMPLSALNPSRPRTVRGALAAIACVALSACTAGASPEPAPAPPPAPDGVVTCRAGDFASFIGKPDSVLAAATFPRGLTIRVIAPGQAVTMDYSDRRANFLTDTRGVIREVTCG